MTNPRSRPPRGYRQDEHALPHDFEYIFSLDGVLDTKNSTIATIFHTTEEGTNPEVIEVNPSNAAFGEDTGPSIFPGSIVPKIQVMFRCSLTNYAIETEQIKALMMHWAPIYTAFLDDIEAQDDRTNTQVEDIIETAHSTAVKQVYPLFSGTDLDNAGNQPFSIKTHAQDFNDFALTTNGILESVAFDKEAYLDMKAYFTNSGKIRKVMPRLNTVMIGDQRPYRHFSNNFTNPTVKRGNPYTFCGILFHLPLAGTYDQIVTSADVTGASPHVNVQMKVRFNEWNQEFDQSRF